MKDDRVRPLNPVEKREEDTNEGGADDEHMTDEMEVTCGECEQAPIKIAKDPGMPTQKEVEEHSPVLRGDT